MGIDRRIAMHGSTGGATLVRGMDLLIEEIMGINPNAFEDERTKIQPDDGEYISFADFAEIRLKAISEDFAGNGYGWSWDEKVGIIPVNINQQGGPVDFLNYLICTAQGKKAVEVYSSDKNEIFITILGALPGRPPGNTDNLFVGLAVETTLQKRILTQDRIFRELAPKRYSEKSLHGEPLSSFSDLFIESKVREMWENGLGKKLFPATFRPASDYRL